MLQCLIIFEKENKTPKTDVTEQIRQPWRNNH